MLQNDSSFLDSKKIIISTHFSATAFPQHLEEFLAGKKISNLLAIEHPLHVNPGKSSSSCKHYKKGLIKKREKSIISNNMQLLNFLKTSWLNIWWVFKSKEKWDLYIGSNNLNTFAGIILKKMGRVRKVAFYTVDFVPNRFDNKFLNNFYHWVDKFGVEHSDETWILSPRVRDGRRKLLNLHKKYDKKQFLVPEAVWIERIKRKPFNQIKKHTAVFVGHLVERMGVQLVIEAIPLIIKKIPDFKFIVIGKGEYRKELEDLVAKLGLKKHVEFKGYVKDHEEVENIIATCAVGIATYTKEDESGLTFYAEPAKTKLYLGAQVPVVMTDTFYNAYDIEKAGGGKVVKENPRDVSKGIVDVIQKDLILKKFRENALRFAKEYDYPYIFTKNLRRVV